MSTTLCFLRSLAAADAKKVPEIKEDEKNNHILWSLLWMGFENNERKKLDKQQKLIYVRLLLL